MKNFKEHFVFEAIVEMAKREIPFVDNIYRPGSDRYFEFFRETRELWLEGKIELNDINEDIIKTDIGEIAEYRGYEVPLDWPMVEMVEKWSEKYKKSIDCNNPKGFSQRAHCQGRKKNESLNEEDPELNKPKRGGNKKFYVYVRDPKTKNIKKVSFGDTTGLKVKLNDPEARKSFAARHKCDTRNDKTKPSYWSCRLPRFAKSLGLQVDNPSSWW